MMRGERVREMVEDVLIQDLRSPSSDQAMSQSLPRETSWAATMCFVSMSKLPKRRDDQQVCSMVAKGTDEAVENKRL
jgi:hypothetical protein